MDETILNEIADILQKALVTQLEIPRLSTMYGSPGIPGHIKPLSGRFSYPPTPAKASGNLINSIGVEWEEDPQTGFKSLVMKMEPYGYFIDQGRKPNKRFGMNVLKPALTKWARIKPLPRFRDKKGRFISNEERAYLITRSVAQYGFGGNSFITKAYEQVAPQLVELYGEEVAAYVGFAFDQMIDNLLNK